MALIQFVQNYQDLSTDKGFQFKFHCDKCGNGYMTRFQASALLTRCSARSAPDCPGCGAAIQPGIKLCAQCGAKLV